MRPSTHPSVLSFRLPGHGRVLIPVRRPQHDATVRQIARVAASLPGRLRAASQPTEPTTTLGQRHAPHGGFLALDVVPSAPPVGLVDGLAADSEGVADLGPASAVAACCGGQQIACIGQRLLGVSHLPEGVQRSLRTAERGLQGLEHPTDTPASEGPLIGAHVNGYWQRPQTASAPFPSISIDPSEAANFCKHSISGKEVNGAPYGDISTPGDYVRPRGPIFGPLQLQKETPQERQLLGVVDDIRGN